MPNINTIKMRGYYVKLKIKR